MDPQRFSQLSTACLQSVEEWLDGFDPEELDYEPSDGVVTFEFADGTKFVLNRQAGNHQMWFAAGVSAWHYDWNTESESWLDDRDGHRLEDNIGRAVSEKLGRNVTLS